MTVLSPEAWMVDALCKEMDPDLFFAPAESGLQPSVKKLCGGCEVTTKCLEYALDNDIREGIWGGTGPGTRLKLKFGGAA